MINFVPHINAMFNSVNQLNTSQNDFLFGFLVGVLVSVLIFASVHLIFWFFDI